MNRSRVFSGFSEADFVFLTDFRREPSALFRKDRGYPLNPISASALLRLQSCLVVRLLRVFFNRASPLQPRSGHVLKFNEVHG
jgi:hypothetical protein